MKRKFFIYAVSACVGIALGLGIDQFLSFQEKREITYLQGLAAKRPDGQAYVAELLKARAQLKDSYKNNDFAAHVSFGVNLNILGEQQKALRSYEKALKVEANNLLVLNNMANIFSDLGQYDKAQVYWLKLTELYPDKTMFWRSLGYLYRYRMQKSSQQIEEFFKKGLAATNNNPDLLTWLIAYFQETGNNEKFAEYANLLSNAKPKQ